MIELLEARTRNNKEKKNQKNIDSVQKSWEEKMVQAMMVGSDNLMKGVGENLGTSIVIEDYAI